MSGHFEHYAEDEDRIVIRAFPLEPGEGLAVLKNLSVLFGLWVAGVVLTSLLAGSAWIIGRTVFRLLGIVE